MATATLGASAINRTQAMGGATLIEGSNPATASCVLTTIKIYLAQAAATMDVAIFRPTGVANTFSTVSTATLINVPAGYSEQTVSLAAQSGDYIGAYLPGSPNGTIDTEFTGGTNIWHYAADGIPCTNQLFTKLSSYIISLSATGTLDVATPTNSSPTDGAADQSITPTLVGSDFSGGSGTHHASQWQITATSGDYSSPVYDSGTDHDNLTSTVIPSSSLENGLTYYWHVRYQDSDEVWSSCSAETSFGTEVGLAAVPMTNKLSNRTLSQRLSNRTAEHKLSNRILTVKSKSI